MPFDDLTLQIYSYESVDTGVPSALLFFRRNAKQEVSGSCLGTINIYICSHCSRRSFF